MKVKYFAYLMLNGYKNLPAIEIAAENAVEAKNKARDLAKKQVGCIAFSVCKRVGNKKREWLG